VRCPLYWACRPCYQNRMLTYVSMNLSLIVPPSVTGSFTPENILRHLPASARGVKPVAWFRQAVHRFAALCYPSPSRVWDRATDGPENFRFPVFLWSLGWLVCAAAFAAEGRQSCRPSGLQDELSLNQHHSWSFPDRPSWLAPRCSGQPVFCPTRFRIRLTPNGSSCLDLSNSFVPEFPIPSEPGFRFRRSRLINRHLHPGMPGWLRSTDNRKTRFDLRHALDCDFIAVISRTLPQSAPATRPFGLLLAYSLSGTSDLLQSPFPVRLQPAAKLTPTAPATWLFTKVSA